MAVVWVLVGPIQPLAWELLYAMGVALKSKKKKKIYIYIYIYIYGGTMILSVREEKLPLYTFRFKDCGPAN